MTAFLTTLRPQQWIKNIFVGAPLVFARHLTEPAYLARSAVAVLAFCLLSGAVYTFNDVRDVEADRAHPTKKNRPVASGQLSEQTALIWAGVLATVSLGGCLVLSWQLAAFAAAYLVQNVAYSVRLKHIAFVDVALLASGFLLRVLAGAAAIAVPASGWLLICTALVALFFGFGKRAHELAWAQRMGDVTTTRASLAGYRLPVVHVLMLVLAVLTCLAYVAYTLDEHTIHFFGTDRLVWSSPFVVFGVIRFLFITLYKPTDDSPTEAMLKDWLFLADLAGATAAVLYIIYW
jgi:decaprenyl-phosphate phosphoribosyltransferase